MEHIPGCNSLSRGCSSSKYSSKPLLNTLIIMYRSSCYVVHYTSTELATVVPGPSVQLLERVQLPKMSRCQRVKFWIASNT